MKSFRNIQDRNRVARPPAVMWLLLSVVLACGMSASVRGEATVWRNVKVVTATGWIYENVDVESTAGESQIWIINQDGARKSLTYDNVRVVTAADGRDITSDVLHGQPAATPPPDQPTSPSGTPRPSRGSYYTSGRRGASGATIGPRFRFALAAGGGVGNASGQYYEGFTNGAAFAAGAKLAVGDNVYLGVNFRYLSLGVEDWLKRMDFYDVNGNYVGSVTDIKASLTEIYFIAGLMTRPSRSTEPIGYIEAGLGSVNHHLAFDITDGVDVISEETNEAKLGVYMSAGGIIPIGPQVGFDINGNLMVTGNGDDDPYDGYDTSTTGVIFGVGLNLVLLMGK